MDVSLQLPPRLPNGERFIFDNPRLYTDDPDTVAGQAALAGQYNRQTEVEPAAGIHPARRRTGTKVVATLIAVSIVASMLICFVAAVLNYLG